MPKTPPRPRPTKKSVKGQKAPGRRPKPARGATGSTKAGARTIPEATIRKSGRPPWSTGEQPARFPIVGIGASAGGLEALESFFAEVEPDSGMAYIVVTHQAPGRLSLLPELLAKHAHIPVTAAENGMKLRPNHAYVAPPGGCLSARDETLCVEATDGAARVLPVDYFFRSLAKNEGDNSIAIVLSGNGSDGTIGITEVKAASGMVMAQDPESARYPGMPNSAVGTQLVDYVLPPKEMPAQLAKYVHRQYRIRATAPEPEAPHPDEVGLQRVLVLLRARTGNDFAAYKKSTVRRRIERRMAVHALRSVHEYAKLLERAPYEVDALFKELLISVTSFFRDPEVFQILEGELGRLIQLKPDDAPLRIWIAGCATGEEAYSLAILVKERLAATSKNLAVQIFATDLDAQAVETARAGKYPEGIAADVSPERLDRFFVKDDSGYRVSKVIRELLIFAPQNLVKDPPFTKLDLLSCRNLLIYLESELQKRVLWLFGYSLRPSGLLLLGTSESVGGFDDLFVPVDKKWKLFQRRDSGASRVPELQTELHPHHPARARHPIGPAPRANIGVVPIAEKVLLSSFVPPSAILSERGELIFVHGRTGPFLEPAPGEPTNNVFNMAREGLRLELPAAVRLAATSDEPIVRRGLQVKTNGGFETIRLTVRKLTEPELLRDTFVATFEREPEEAKRPKSSDGRSKEHQNRIVSLEKELQGTRESLQGTIEELETSNEELETSREEMQSLNEELQTVNAELEERNGALSQANDDMQNLLNSTEIATIFLDEKLAIKRFTTQAKKVFSLIDTDIGRPIADLTANLRYDRLVDEAREVLQTLVFREREIQTKEGSWRLMRVMPYRTHENLIDGLVITFVDIDRVKRAEEAAQNARLYAESIVEAVRVSLLMLDDQLRVVSANRAFYDAFRMTPKLVVGESLHHLADGCWDVPALTGALRKVVADDDVMMGVPVSITLPKLGTRKLSVSARRMPGGSGHPRLVLLAIEAAASSDIVQGEG